MSNKANTKNSKKKNKLTYFSCVPNNLKFYLFSDIEEISDAAAKYCISLEYAIFDGVKIIGASAFENCPDLQVIRFKKAENALEIRIKAFKDCQRLHTVVFPCSLKNFDEANKQNENNEQNDSITCTETNENPKTLQTNYNLTIEKDAFTGCTALRTVVFGNGSVRIHDDAFTGCDLDKLTFVINDNPDAERFAREHGIRCVHADNI